MLAGNKYSTESIQRPLITMLYIMSQGVKDSVNSNTILRSAISVSVNALLSSECSHTVPYSDLFSCKMDPSVIFIRNLSL